MKKLLLFSIASLLFATAMPKFFSEEAAASGSDTDPGDEQDEVATETPEGTTAEQPQAPEAPEYGSNGQGPGTGEE